MSQTEPLSVGTQISERPSDISGENVNQISQPPPRKRRRPALACTECRRRKIRCDRRKPCTQCVQWKCMSCIYTPLANQLLPNRALVGNGPRASLLESGEGRYSTDASDLLAVGSSSTPGYLALNPNLYLAQSAQSGITSNNDRTTQKLLSRIHDLEQELSNSERSLPKNNRNIGGNSQASSTKMSSTSMREVLSKTRMYGQTHWMAQFQEFQKMAPFNYWTSDGAFVRNERYKDSAREISVYLDKCKRLGRAIKAQLPSRWHVRPNPQNQDDFRKFIPPRASADKLIDAYLRCFESTYRVLHIPSFRNEVAQHWRNPEASSIGFVMKLFLVMAIGASLYEDPDGNPKSKSDVLQWIFAAQSWLSVPFEKSRLNLTGLQIYCLLLIARQYVSVSSQLVWISAGSLMRTAMHMGLHRDPRNFENMSVMNMEIRRRLWATILELCLQSSFDSGMPSMFSFGDFDTGPPSNINDTDIDETTILPPLSEPNNAFTQTSIQIMLFISLPVRLEVSRIANDFRAESDYSTVLRLGSEILKTSREFNTLITSIPGQTGGPTSFHRNLVIYHTQRFLLTLHQPFAFKSREDPRYYFSRKICLETTLNFASSLSTDYYNLMTIGGGLFRTIFLHSMIIFWFEVITQHEEDGVNGILDEHRQSVNRAPIRAACEKLSSMLDDRLRHGETNVKEKMFMSMIIAKIEAIESGTSQEQAMFAGAKRSMKACYELLRSRLQSLSKDTLQQGQYDEGLGEEGAFRGGEEMQQDFQYDFSQDGNLNFEFPDSLMYFQGWDENSWIV